MDLCLEQQFDKITHQTVSLICQTVRQSNYISVCHLTVNIPVVTHHDKSEHSHTHKHTLNTRSHKERLSDVLKIYQ